MAVVRMHIDKFGGVVLIEEDHPLAVAQRARNAQPPALVLEDVAPAPTVVAPPKPKPKAKAAPAFKKKRR